MKGGQPKNAKIFALRKKFEKICKKVLTKLQNGAIITPTTVDGDE